MIEARLVEIREIEDSVEEQKAALKSEEHRKEMALRYLPLVKHIVHRIFVHIPKHISRDDLYSAGVLGLMEAIDKYQDNQQVTFKTYAFHRIRGAILDELRSYDLISRSARRKLKMFEEAAQMLEKETSSAPSEEQIAERLCMDVEEYRRQLHGLAPVKMMTFTDLNAKMGFEGCIPPLPSEDYGRENQDQAEDLQLTLVEKLKHIPKMERLVITLYYYEQMTMKEIAFVLHVSEGRVSQLHTQAILRLRRFLSGMAG